MKFGCNLPRNQIPEWSSNYIDYKGLKKLIQGAAVCHESDEDADLAEFFFYLDRNLEDVDHFYNKRFFDTSRRLKVLQERYGTLRQATDCMEHSEIDDVINGLLELRGQLRKLQWFGEVNRRGFVKITKKLDKRFPSSCTQQRYLVSKVNQKPFSTDVKVLAKIAEINDWLLVFGDVKNGEDNNSVHTTRSLTSVSSKENIRLPNGLFDTAVKALKTDDASLFGETLGKYIIELDSPEVQKLLITFLQRAISYRSKHSLNYLFEKIKSLDEPDSINQRNCIHRLLISIGRVESSKPEINGTGQISDLESTKDLRSLMPALTPTSRAALNKPVHSEESSIDETASFLNYILKNLRPHQRAAIVSRDMYGRVPLHYAAQLKYPVISEIVMKYMYDWELVKSEYSIYAVEWQDHDALTPLHLSIMEGNTLTTQTLLSMDKIRRSNCDEMAPLISLATKFNFMPIVKLLVDEGVDINWQDGSGETALHIAARFGHKECAEFLLKSNSKWKANFELTEKKFSWTPLHVACVDGHLSIVELLIEVGANLTKPDVCGWTAREHAALRGHMAIAKKLESIAPSEERNSESQTSLIDSGLTVCPPILSSMEASRSLISATRSNETVKSFGHRYLTNKSLILVSLGSMDTRKITPAVSLEKISIAKAHLTQLDTALSIIVSAEGAQGEPVIIDLPIQENISTEPILFTAFDAAKVKIYFDIVPTYSGNLEDKLGRGVALLSSIKQAIGMKRMDLQGDVNVPILGTNLEVIGSVNFNCLVITPFSHPNMNITTKQTYWKEMSSTMVIGHRGLGKNLTSNKSLQLGENTLQSFIAAANLGANYVEFDVQLTKDHIPVIYHDFLVSETGIDAPVHTLTLEQFLHVNDNTPRVQRSITSPNDTSDSKDANVLKGITRHRSHSLSHSIPDDKMSERMKHTRDFKEKGYKANSRGNFIQAPFTTLEEMFLKLPEHVGFNIEMKYPMLHESENHEMDAYAVELNSFVDTVLTKVYDLGKKRKIIFSSFNPDICLLLSFKQPSIPILFLTDAGTSPVGDIRASSLHEAIRFASRWNLLGIVSAAEPLCNSPRLVRVVKESGLVCVSYGTLNNDPVKVQKQVEEGIDAVIVDSVLKIRNRLTKNAAKT